MSDKASRARLARAAERLGGTPRLPALVLMTDDVRLPEPMDAVRALPKGSAVIVRARRHREELAGQVMKVAKARRLIVLVAGDAQLAVRLGADGVHLAEARAREAPHWRARFPHLIITCAVHSPRGLHPAAVDAVLLSPVFATPSHPQRAALGAARANLMAFNAPVAVYALGGIAARNAARLAGFKGIAAIGALKP